MANEYVITTNESGDLAVRTVSATEASNITDTLSVITRTDDGKLAVRTVGGSGGGGDQHNLGYYATQSALEEAHPTAEAGDWAIVGATDTVWIWDTDNSAWVDSDQKGQVTSVNNRTGAVTVSEVPDQTGQSGKFLTTDGTDASWSDKPLVNSSTAANSVIIDKSPSGNATLGRGSSVSIGYTNSLGAIQGVVVGISSSTTGTGGVAVGYNATGAAYGVAIGRMARASANYAIQLGGDNATNNNTDANTFKVGNANGNYEIMSADGTIPADRLTHAINKYSTMPTAASTNEGWIVQFTGTTDATYTHGYIYECKAQGTDPETYAWEAVSVQPAGLVNTATGTGSVTIAGVGTSQAHATNIGVASQVQANGVAVGNNTAVFGNGAIAVGFEAQLINGSYSVAIGKQARVTAANAIQLGSSGVYGNQTNSDANTFKVANANGNFELMNANGNLPADRLASTTGLADGNYRLRLVMASGVPTLEWVAE